jgi:hypothetical protein
VSVLLTRLLVLLGVGFLAANLLIVARLIRYVRLRKSKVLTWPGKKPPFYGLFLLLGVVLGILVFVKLVVLGRPPLEVFGEFMMLLYYGYLVPISLRIGRGFYEQGVWFDAGGFLPYSKIGGISWREGNETVLLFIPRMKQLAHPLTVPHHKYAEARRFLRDRIKSHDIHFAGETLDLGGHDEREDV